MSSIFPLSLVAHATHAARTLPTLSTTPPVPTLDKPQRPPKVVHNYPTISQDDWEKFIAYQRTPEFKRLSEQGNEIRKKSKYRSTRDRDGYRKRDQIHFENSRKWAEQHTRWLDMRVKPDGEFKNTSFKIIADTIALGNAEHSGWIRGQSKFVKQSQYFNLVQSSRENAEETTTLTVDQHNSFKASCTLNEKEAGPSDLQPMPNASKECQLFLIDLVNGGDVLVAIGKAYMDCVPTDIVHGIPLGEENVRVTITVPNLKRALKPILTNEATCIEEVVGGHAPDREAEGSKRTKKRAGKKKIQLQPEVQQQPAQQELPSFDFSDFPFELRPLAYMDCVPTDTVHGISLGEENVRVTITVPKLKCALLPIPTNEATCIEEAVGGFVAWPKRL
ncbi:hypothetical protein TIFTF001_027940, partial [Ficus carica]